MRLLHDLRDDPEIAGLNESKKQTHENENHPLGRAGRRIAGRLRVGEI
jgi:hypothetical protein